MSPWRAPDPRSACADPGRWGVSLWLSVPLQPLWTLSFWVHGSWLLLHARGSFSTFMAPPRFRSKGDPPDGLMCASVWRGERAFQTHPCLSRGPWRLGMEPWAWGPTHRWKWTFLPFCFLEKSLQGCPLRGLMARSLLSCPVGSSAPLPCLGTPREPLGPGVHTPAFPVVFCFSSW